MTLPWLAIVQQHPLSWRDNYGILRSRSSGGEQRHEMSEHILHCRPVSMLRAQFMYGHETKVTTFLRMYTSSCLSRCCCLTISDAVLYRKKWSTPSKRWYSSHSTSSALPLAKTVEQMDRSYSYAARFLRGSSDRIGACVGNNGLYMSS